MPYIEQASRDKFDIGPEGATKGYYTSEAETPGELNYLISKVCIDYLNQAPTSYGRLNAIIGALEAAKLEFYCRVVRPYEDRKCKTNGDVYIHES